VPHGRAPAPRPPSGRVVLVVEDEFLIAMDLELLLRRHGWRVLGPAATVDHALRLLRGATPDVALLERIS
jgi:two-component system, response regulator PdtaR